MGSHDGQRRGLGLRTRFLLAAAALVLTAVLASVWTLGALSRLGTAVSETQKQNDEATRATAQVAGALEREDDALLLILSGDASARQKLAAERLNVDGSVATLDEVLNAPFEQDLVDGLRRALDEYRRAADRIALDTPGSLVRYHQEVNPLLRSVVSYTGRLRDRHFESTQHVAVQAREEVARARNVVLGITLGALFVSVLLALQLARLVVVPVLEMTRGVTAMTRTTSTPDSRSALKTSWAISPRRSTTWRSTWRSSGGTTSARRSARRRRSRPRSRRCQTPWSCSITRVGRCRSIVRRAR